MNSYFHLLSKESLINLNQSKIMEMYEIGDQLGKGAQGVVYKAARRSDRRRIALKVVDLNNVDAHHLSLVEGESDIMSTLADPGNPHIVSYYGSHRIGNIIYIELGHINGINMTTLAANYHESKCIALELWDSFLLSAAIDILNGVRYIHSFEILHDDIRADNVMIEKENYAAKIIDFGVASRLTSSRSEKEKLNDLWSVGALLYTAITEKMYPRVNTKVEVSNQSLKHIVNCLLQKNPIIASMSNERSPVPPDLKVLFLRQKE